QEENMRLKQLVAELTLDKAMLQDVLSKKGEAFTAWTDGRGTGGSYGVSPSKKGASLNPPMEEKRLRWSSVTSKVCMPPMERPAMAR
ncbi:hypothetical protein, partial [Edaphobacter sp.]|uniref:hypothetical protein n=1 Tax=Edaphobacter sp. TaxID=1934404 RepID=UPI0039C8B680